MSYVPDICSFLGCKLVFEKKPSSSVPDNRYFQVTFLLNISFKVPKRCTYLFWGITYMNCTACKFWTGHTQWSIWNSMVLHNSFSQSRLSSVILMNHNWFCIAFVSFTFQVPVCYFFFIMMTNCATAINVQIACPLKNSFSLSPGRKK